MAIQENQLNDQALAQLAGNRVGNLNLPLHAVDYSGLTKPLFDSALAQYQGNNQLLNTKLQGQNLQDLAKSQGQNELQRQLLANKGASDVQNQSQLFQSSQNELDRVIKQQEVDQSGQYQKGMLDNAAKNQAQQGAFQQGQLQIEAQKAQTEQAQQQSEMHLNNLKGAMMLKKDQRTMGGAIASGYIASMMAAKTPEEQQQAAQHWQNVGVAQGVFSDTDQAAQMLANDPVQGVNNARYLVTLAGMADNATGKGLGVSPTGNFIMTRDSKGNAVPIIPLSPEDMKANAQQMSKLQQQQAILQNLQKTYNPSWDQGLNKLAIPLVGGIESSTGIGDGSNSYAELEGQKTEWNALAQRANVDYLTTVPGAKPSNRSIGLVSRFAINPGDNATIKQAKLAAMNQSLQLQTNMLGKTSTNGMQLNDSDNQYMNDQLDNIGKNYYGAIGENNNAQ